MKFLLIANPENRRADYFLEACAVCGLPEPVVISWLEVLSSEWEFDWLGIDALRIESAGENFLVERELIAIGAGVSAEEGVGFCRLSEGEARTMEDDHGRLRFGRQWYHGWCAVLAKIARAVPESVKVMNAPSEIALMFDKLASQECLEHAGVRTPERFGLVDGFDDLMDRLDSTSVNRVFLKPCHGSSASGVVAFERSGERIRATTSVAMERVTGEIRLYNSLRLRSYAGLLEVGELVNALAGERLMVERWVPKAGHAGCVFDLRVLVIAGEARHVVMRASRSPITNLHLGNRRGDLEALRVVMGEKSWAEGMAECVKAAAVFPSCHYVAVDLLVGIGMRRFVVAEVNAFGDLIPRIESRGESTYVAEVREFCS